MDSNEVALAETESVAEAVVFAMSWARLGKAVSEANTDSLTEELPLAVRLAAETFWTATIGFVAVGA